MSNAETTTPSVQQSRWSPTIKWSALVIGIFLIVFTYFDFFVQDQHTAEAYLRIKQSEPLFLFESAADIDPRQKILFKSTQVEMIRTPFVLSAALKRPTMAELPFIGELKEPVKWLQRKLQVEFDDDTEVVRLSLQCPDKVAAVAILNAVLEAYMDEMVLKERDSLTQRLDRLERVRSESEDKIRQKRSEMLEIADDLEREFLESEEATLMRVGQEAARLRVEISQLPRVSLLEPARIAE
jgi:capsule polysaccharide export protein KpsE/RkpR